jgi:hypothetical protein
MAPHPDIILAYTSSETGNLSFGRFTSAVAAASRQADLSNEDIETENNVNRRLSPD